MNNFELLNEEGVTIVASSRKGTEEVWSRNGELYHVYHYKSGRDLVTPIKVIPEYLTIRYDPPKLAEGLLHEFIER